VATVASPVPATNLAAVKVPALKLQAIVFVPTRSSAMINGKTLFVGDKLNELQVVEIKRESVTLVGGGQTNVLGLTR
jgi:hypothetical protein